MTEKFKSMIIENEKERMYESSPGTILRIMKTTEDMLYHMAEDTNRETGELVDVAIKLLMDEIYDY